MYANHYGEVDPVKQHIRSDMTSDIEDTIVEMYRHTRIYAEIMFPEHFYREFDKPYDELFDAFDDPSIMKLVLGGPRGVGKSTVGGLVLPSKKLLFHESHFTIPTSATATLATDQSETLKHEFKTNPQIATFFPNFKIGVDAKEQWTIISEDADGQPYYQMVRPRSAGQQVRGQKFIKYRPDLLLPDDLEKKEESLSDEQREKLKEWFYSDYVLSVNRDSSSWKICYLGTLLHEDALLQELMDDPTWTTIKLPLCNEQYESLFPNYIPTEDVPQEDGTVIQGTKGMAEEYRQKGRLDTFHMEYMVEPQSGKDALFQQKMFKYWGQDEKDDIKTTLTELIMSPHTESVVIVDPAKSVTKTSAETAITGIIVDYKRHALFVADIVHGKMHPNEQYDATFKMIKDLRCNVVGLEKTGLEEFITYPFRNEMARRGVNVQLIELKARGGQNIGRGEGKLRRIAGGLGPFYRRGEVYHNRTVCGGLEIQLLGFPKSKRKDIMDSFAYIAEILELGLRYFFHDWFDTDGEYAEEGQAIEAEYDELKCYDDDEAFEFEPILTSNYGLIG